MIQALEMLAADDEAARMTSTLPPSSKRRRHTPFDPPSPSLTPRRHVRSRSHYVSSSTKCHSGPLFCSRFSIMLIAQLPTTI